LGHMGLPMARNLLRNGYAVTAFDLADEPLQSFARDGGQTAGSAADAARDARVVISMLPASRHVQGLYLGDEGLLQTISPGSLVLECSTIAPAAARELHAAAAARGIALLDAPVSGGTAGAAAGTLTFMVGGTAEHLQQARPILAAMGRNIFHAGPEGAGQVAKVCNNQLLAVHMIGTAEAMALGVANGLEPAALAENMRQSSGGNGSLEEHKPTPGATVKLPAANGRS